MSKRETDIQAEVRLRASQRGITLWRNNRGAMQDATGRWVRFGLANDSKTVAEQLASADLIGITPLLIGPEHVGHVVGVFTSIEVKRPGEKPTEAQSRWLELVLRLGGIARVVTRAEDI